MATSPTEAAVCMGELGGQEIRSKYQRQNIFENQQCIKNAVVKGILPVVSKIDGGVER